MILVVHFIINIIYACAHVFIFRELVEKAFIVGVI